MFLKIASLCFLLTFAYWFLPSSAEPQYISSEIYETEEDLLEGLEKGYLTLDQYLELLDMIQRKVYGSSKEADKLIFVPDVSSLDVLQVKAKDQGVDLSQKVGSFLAEEKKKSRLPFSGRLVWKLHQELAEEGAAENYLLCQVTNGRRMIWHIEADQQANSSQAPLTSGDLRVRRRSVKFLVPEYSSEVILGNFDQRIGLGLNVGYHPLFGYSSDSDFESENSFLYPALGRFNGIYEELKLKSLAIVAFYSRNKREGIENRIGALDLSLSRRGVDVGLCISRGELRNTEDKNVYTDDCKSLHFNWKLKPLTLSGEYALLPSKKSGLAFELYSSRKSYSFDLSWWRYEDQFVHPHGGGVSNPDYESINLDDIDYTYRSRQAGERGVFFKSRYTILRRLSLDFSYSQWRERSNLPDKMKLRLGSGYKFSQDFSFTVYQLWTDYRLDNELIDRRTSSLNLLFSPHDKLNFNLIANYRKTLSKDYGDLRLKIRTRSISPFDFVLWLKYNDPNFSRRSDGYLSFHLQETLRFFENCFVSAEYVAKIHQNENKVDTRGVRIRMETLW